MPNVLRDTWSANRHWLAAGFLLATALFLLFIWFSVHDTFRGVAESKQTYLQALANSPVSLFVPGFRRATLDELSETRHEYFQIAPAAASAQAGGVIGGIVGGVPGGAADNRAGSDDSEEPTRMIVRTGTLSILAEDPKRVADQVRALAERMSGFVVNSTVSGDRDARTAQVTIRIPASRFDEAREQVRQLAKKVEQDSTQAEDVTREAVEKDATLRNARAEEAQYLALLRRSGNLKDVLAVSEHLADVRGRIQREEADLRYLRHQVAMSLLTVGVRAVMAAPPPGMHWRPLVAARLSVVEALDALGDFADSVVALLLYVPVIAAWVLLAFAILKVAWWMLVRLARLFFPGMPWWKRSEPAQAR